MRTTRGQKKREQDERTRQTVKRHAVEKTGTHTQTRRYNSDHNGSNGDDDCNDDDDEPSWKVADQNEGCTKKEKMKKKENGERTYT